MLENIKQGREMKTVNSVKLIAISAVASLFLVACGGGSSSTAATTPAGTKISGTAIDPEIQGANVYLDANGNGQYDVGETNTTTDKFGKYVLNILASDIGKQVIVEGGIDKVTKEDFKGKLKVIARSDDAEHFITPLTTLVAEYKENDNNKSVADIKDEIALKLGLANADDLDKDILKDTKLLKLALRIQKITQKVADTSKKDISEIYKNLASKLSEDDFDTALQGTIDDDINATSFDYKRAIDLDRELKRVDETTLDAEKFALTVDNIDRNITASTTELELDEDLFDDEKMIISDDQEAKELKDRKVLKNLGFEDLSDAVKQKLIANGEFDFAEDPIDEIKKKIAQNNIGLSTKEKAEIDREDLFNEVGLQDISSEKKKKLKDQFDNEDFDFSKVSKEDLEKKLKENKFSSLLPEDVRKEIEDRVPFDLNNTAATTTIELDTPDNNESEESNTSTDTVDTVDATTTTEETETTDTTDETNSTSTTI